MLATAFQLPHALCYNYNAASWGPRLLCGKRRKGSLLGLRVSFFVSSHFDKYSDNHLSICMS
jgi:hypothetical protein